MFNRIGNLGNPYQGHYKRVLCVCSAGLLRSPTAAVVLSRDPFNFNTRAAGIDREFALIPVDEALITWAEEIVCMEKRHAEQIEGWLEEYGRKRPVVVLNVPDKYPYRDTELEDLIFQRYKAHLGETIVTIKGLSSESDPGV